MTNPTPTRPTHRLYTVKGEGDIARWIEIGASWTNRDGQGFTLIFDALPIDGRVVMREITERTEGGQQ
jgi:hypothetical protein